MDKIVKAMRLKTGFEPLILDETTIAHFYSCVLGCQAFEQE